MTPIQRHLAAAHEHMHAQTTALMSDDAVSAATHAEEAHEDIHRAMLAAVPPPDAAALVTEAELAEVERLDAEATEGPWTINGGDVVETEYQIDPEADEGERADVCEVLHYGRDRGPFRTGTARFIARARSLMPRLAAEVRRLTAELDAARAEIARLTAVKSAEIAPIIERFQAAFGADAPKAPSFTAAPGEPAVATHAEILGGDSRTIVATHEVRLDGETAIVAEQWTDGAEVVKRYEVRLRFALLVHLALNTTPEERREIDARGDWRGAEDAES